MLTVGLGVVAAVVGSLLAGSILAKVSGPSTWASSVASQVLVECWAWAVLPLILMGVGRVINVPPLGTAVVAMLSGQAFRLAILYASFGIEGLHRDIAESVIRVAALGVGLVLGWRALVAGKAATAARQARADAVAASRAAEYEAFRQESERVASRRDERA